MKIRAFNSEKMGQNNRLALLNALRNRPGISRSDLAILTGLDPSTITKTISLFLEQGLVEEIGERKSSGAGRRSVSLAIRRDAGVAVAVKVGVERTAIARGYLDNTFELFAEFPTAHDPHVFFDSFTVEAQRIFASLLPEQQPVAFSFALPGMVDNESGMGIDFPHLGWKDVDFHLEIARRLPHFDGLLFFANEAQLSLTAEAQKNPKLASTEGGIYIYIAHGVGGALLLKGSVYRGSSNCAGELGHMVIDAKGPRCHCGNNGCLESFVSIERVVVEYEKTAPSLEGDSCRDKFTTLLARAEAQEPEARKAIEHMMGYLVLGMKNLVNIFNPEFIMLGGMGAAFSDALVNELQTRLSQQVLRLATKKLRIVKASMGIDDSALLGATLIAMDCFSKTVVV